MRRTANLATKSPRREASRKSFFVYLGGFGALWRDHYRRGILLALKVTLGIEFALAR